MNKKRIISFVLALVMVLSMVPGQIFAAAAAETTQPANELAGKTISVLGASISTYAGASNGAAADTTNSTIRNNVKYYPNSTIPEVTLNDTWWMQVAEDLGLRLLVNNAWSGSAILLERSGTVGAYVDRCVQLHDNTGDNAGEEPDIICIQMGFNDFSYGKSTLGTADIDYDTLITAGGYGTPSTTMEATAILLDKMTKRYPNAEIYIFNHFKRIGQSASDTALMEGLNASIETVCARYGVTVVDLYTALTDPAHIGDGRLHPNRLGMDTITEAVKRAILANTAYEVDTHTVTMELDGVTADYGTDRIVVSGDPFELNLTPTGDDALQVTVTMGGADITDSAYADGTVTIDAVTANVAVIAKSVHEPQHYRWEFDGTDLVCVSGGNALTKNAGTTADGVFSSTRYFLETSVVLAHDREWAVEWKSEGTFQNAGGSSGARIFTSDDVNAHYNARYIFKSNANGLIAMGEKTTTGSHNYGIALADHNIDWTVSHVYRLENRIAADGSNMVWLYVDGAEIGPMTDYFVGTTRKNTTSDWLSGKDFVFPYMGTDTHGFTNCSIEYIEVWETTEDLPLHYDDRYDVTGKTVEIVDAGAPTSYQVGYGVEENAVRDTAVITLDGDKLIATGIGTAQVEIDGVLYEVTVEAAPINLFMITGHSLGAGQCGSANLSVVCPEGQVYSSFGTKNLAAATAGVGISYAAEEKANNINAFTDAGSGTVGEGSAMAWEYNRLTGEKVWILNTAVGGSNLKEWLPGTTHYKNAVAQFSRAQAILSNEIQAGHYVLGHMGIIYHNGANFSYKGVNFTQADLQNWYDTMWSSMKSDLSCDVDGNGENETLGFLGLVPIWYKSAGFSYTFDEPAGMFMAASQEYPDIFTASTIGQEWLSNDAVASNFPDITYTTQSGVDLSRPITTSGVFSSDNVHYLQVAYNAVGIDIAGNIYDYLNKSDVDAEITLLVDGSAEVSGEVEITYGMPILLTPVAEPVYANGFSFETEGCVELVYPLQIAATGNGAGALTVFCNGEIVEELKFRCSGAPETLLLRYDDHYDVIGKTVEILDAGVPVSQDDAVVALNGDTLIATGVGTAKVLIDGVLHEITVEKAKVNLVMIMGQSNAGNHFANATSAVTCPAGTAYWWKYGATEPVDYTQPSMGFHTPLLAELYAQSAAAGDPVKNVLLWAEGYTSKNGKSITTWATESGGEISTAGTDGAAKMMRDCLTYYEQRSDKYEIVGKGVYWLQGESDLSMDPQRYIGLFTAMWERLKAEGMEYLCFLRVRGAHSLYTPENADVYYNAASSAQFEMVRTREDMFMASTVTENWTGSVNTSHSVDISNYITMVETYGQTAEYSDSYGNKATYADGILTTTMKELYGSNNKVHYGIFGYGIIGADAAVNAYATLHGSGAVSVVQTDSSGRKSAEHIAPLGSAQTLNIEGLEHDLSFYPACGSPAGTMTITVTAEGADITERVISRETSTYGTVDVDALRNFVRPVITVSYTCGGQTGASTYAVEFDHPCNAGHTYTPAVTPPTCTQQGYTTYTCSCGDSYLADYTDALGYDHILEDGVFNLLLVGNSFSEDASSCGQGMTTSQLLDVLQAVLGEDVEICIGLVYSGGKSMAWHATQAEQGNEAHSLRVIRSGEVWASKGKVTLSDALSWADWDIVTLQSYGSERTGMGPGHYVEQEDEKFYALKDSSAYLLDLCDTLAPNADIYYYLTWAQSSSSVMNTALSAYNKLTEYTPTVMSFRGTESGARFAGIIPVGTAVQNARTTYLATLQYNTTAYADGNLNLYTDAQIGLQRDGGHLSFNIGRYLAAVTFAEILVPQEMREEGYELPHIRITESVGRLPDQYAEIVQKAVFAAVEGLAEGSLAVTSIIGYDIDPIEQANELDGMVLNVGCAANETALCGLISAAVLSKLPKDFAVDSVALADGSCTVVVRFGYSSREISLSFETAEHTYTPAVTAPTCTEQGYTTYTCTCGDSYVADYVEATGIHTYEDAACTQCGAILYGDTNGDGKVTVTDLAMLRKYLANKDPVTGESDMEVAAGVDVNGDGKVTVIDLAMLRKYLANKDPVTGESAIVLGPRN